MSRVLMAAAGFGYTFLALVVVRGFPTDKVWGRLSQVDPSGSILHDRVRLLQTAATFEGPSGSFDQTVETRWEALKRLLELEQDGQNRTIRGSPQKGIGIDHRVVAQKSATSESITLVATLFEAADLPGRHPWFWQAKYKSDHEDYWSMDVLEFDRSGRLLRRFPYQQVD